MKGRVREEKSKVKTKNRYNTSKKEDNNNKAELMRRSVDSNKEKYKNALKKIRRKRMQKSRNLS